MFLTFWKPFYQNGGRSNTQAKAMSLALEGHMAAVESLFFQNLPRQIQKSNFNCC